MYNRDSVLQLIESNGLWHEITEHEALFSMKDSSEVVMPYEGCDAKNLFLRDKKKKEYFLITVKGDKRVDLRAFREEHGTRALTFASADDLMAFMGLIPGSVTPLGLLNDEERKIRFFYDEDFWDEDGIIGLHPLINTETLWLKISDLISLIVEHGSEVNKIKIPEKEE